MACPFATTGAPLPMDHPSVTSSTEKVQEIPIPQPPPSLFLGNIPDMDVDAPEKGIQRLTNLYGDIFRLQLDVPTVVVSSQALVNEVCDQERFHKDLSATLRELRPLVGDGLFTSAHEDGTVIKREENWWKAHRLLVPGFGPLGLRKMFDDMLDISSQLVLRWDRMGEEYAIDCSDDFTRLAFDTIGLCSFGYRFNEFYTDDVHPFAKQMTDVLKQSGRRANRTSFENTIRGWEEQRRQEDVRKMHDLARKIIANRKANPKPNANDLLNVMLYAEDRETGERLGDENVVKNMVTFLVAGHETTSATLSFLWYYLLKNPQAFLKAQQEVDEVVGDGVVTLGMLPKLTYLDACIKEALRLGNSIPFLSLTPKESTFLANGKYRVDKGSVILVNLAALHHDSRVWGDDHSEFKPERFLDGKFQSLPPNAWKPFGNGLRACIGRGFAEQEMLINTTMILQRFNPEMADPSYQLRTKSSLTVKPDQFRIKIRRRPGKSILTGLPGTVSTSLASTHAARETKEVQRPKKEGSGRKVRILYGGNSGTCEGFAQSLEATLTQYGIFANIASLDSATEHLDAGVPTAIIASSYEGLPPDNAKRFVAWLERLKGRETLKGVSYSIMGVGNSDWASTFHRIPKLIENKLQDLGAAPIAPSGFANVKTDLIGPFDDWCESLLKALAGESINDTPPPLQISLERMQPPENLDDRNMDFGVVLENRTLADATVGLAKKHIEIRLPAGTSYQAGDYLAVQPRNSSEAVTRVLQYFEIDPLTTLAVSNSPKKHLPATPTPISTFLHNHVELGTPATFRQLTSLAGPNPPPPFDISDLISKRYTLLDAATEFSLPLTFPFYLSTLVPLVPRQYSISSSPLCSPASAPVVSLTYDVHASPARSGHGLFAGACSGFLSSLRTGDRVLCSVRETRVDFRLPADPAVPVIMFAAGTGIAPMKAFLQERAEVARSKGDPTGGEEKKETGAVLFYGCRDPEKDFIYKDELAGWEEEGIVEVHPAFSRGGGEGVHGYVQDAIWAQRERVADMFGRGGKVYVCGSAERLGKSCAEVCKKIWRERFGGSEEDAETWFEGIRNERYVSDVY